MIPPSGKSGNIFREGRYLSDVFCARGCAKVTRFFVKPLMVKAKQFTGLGSFGRIWFF
jgi:hypothetical protein